jgi:hypothetical protein
MQPAFIISAYQRPDLLARLVETLRPYPVAIHIDKKSDIGPDVQRRLGSRPGVTYLPRHICHWGLFGHVEASLEGLKWFLGTSCDYAILLTGQCYPLKRMTDIVGELTDLEGRSILEHAAFPKPEWLRHDEGGYRRLRSFYVKLPLRQAPKSIKLWDRRVPGGLHPYGGSSYWCLSRACAGAVMRRVEHDPGLLRFFRRTLIPDEMFFQTVLANSPRRDELIDARIHYLDFSAGGSNPAIIREEALAAAMASGAWFARKFEDQAVLDRVDTLRDAGNPAPAPWRRHAEAMPSTGAMGASAAPAR